MTGLTPCYFQCGIQSVRRNCIEVVLELLCRALPSWLRLRGEAFCIGNGATFDRQAQSRCVQTPAVQASQVAPLASLPSEASIAAGAPRGCKFMVNTNNPFRVRPGTSGRRRSSRSRYRRSNNPFRLRPRPAQLPVPVSSSDTCSRFLRHRFVRRRPVLDEHSRSGSSSPLAGLSYA